MKENFNFFCCDPIFYVVVVLGKKLFMVFKHFKLSGCYVYCLLDNVRVCLQGSHRMLPHVLYDSLNKHTQFS
jgi:hypothetical protein